MSTETAFQVCGVSSEGHGWHEPQTYRTYEEANAQAEHWIKFEPEVWVEKVTVTREIVKSISTSLPPREHIPA